MENHKMPEFERKTTSVLLVNEIVVPTCSCSPGPVHWSIKDIKEALGREITDADSLTVRTTEVNSQ